MRRRVTALIEQDGRLLVVRQRARDPAGRHDGVLYLTPPGGGIKPGETPMDAVIREVQEEVGLIVASAAFFTRVDYPGGSTSVYDVVVERGEPALGVDPEMECDCPRLVGFEWVPAPSRGVWNSADAMQSLKVEVTDA